MRARRQPLFCLTSFPNDSIHQPISNARCCLSMNNRRENRTNGNQEKGWREEEVQQEALSFLLMHRGTRQASPKLLSGAHRKMRAIAFVGSQFAVAVRVMEYRRCSRAGQTLRKSHHLQWNSGRASNTPSASDVRIPSATSCTVASIDARAPEVRADTVSLLSSRL